MARGFCRLCGLGVVVLLVALGSLALAQGARPDGNAVAGGALFEAIDWWTVDGGGGTASGGHYSVRGTLGQPEPGVVSGGGIYQVQGGFWSVAAGREAIYLPYFER